MNEHINEGNEQIIPEVEILTENSSIENNTETMRKHKKKMSKMKFAIIGVIVAFIAIVTVITLAIGSVQVKKEKERIESVISKCVNLAGMISERKNTFSLDTNPRNEVPHDGYEAYSAKKTEEGALAAIAYANKELGFSDNLYQDMIRTTADMGTQNKGNFKYKVSWRYHPTFGLEVTYTMRWFSLT